MLVNTCMYFIALYMSFVLAGSEFAMYVLCVNVLLYGLDYICLCVYCYGMIFVCVNVKCIHVCVCVYVCV